jgi:hypothetical protein
LRKAMLVPIVLLVAGCERKAAPLAPGFACLVLPSEPPADAREAWNPLLAGQPVCFETADACARARDAMPGKPVCNAVGDAAWNCHLLTGAASDPLAGSGVCFPSPLVCDQAAEAWAKASSGPRWLCAAASAVHCTTLDARLTCYPERIDCERAEALTSKVVAGTTRKPCRPFTTGP